MNQFKNYLKLFFIGVFSISLLVSCGDDDDEDGFSIIGSWVLSQEQTIGCTDPADNSSESTTCTETDCERLVFSADGTFTAETIEPGAGSFEFSGTYRTEGSNLIVDFGFDADTINYSVTAANLVLTEEPQTDGCVEIYTYTKE